MRLPKHIDRSYIAYKFPELLNLSYPALIEQFETECDKKRDLPREEVSLERYYAIVWLMRQKEKRGGELL